jgi:hypothetical protein
VVSTQFAGAITVTAITVGTIEAATKMIAAKTITTATITAAAGKCAGGKPATSENKKNCRYNESVAQHLRSFFRRLLYPA